MKVIKYTLRTFTNQGTFDNPSVVAVFTNVEIECPTDEDLTANLKIAKREAYNGKYTVE